MFVRFFVLLQRGKHEQVVVCFGVGPRTDSHFEVLRCVALDQRLSLIDQVYFEVLIRLIDAAFRSSKRELVARTAELALLKKLLGPIDFAVCSGRAHSEPV